MENEKYLFVVSGAAGTGHRAAHRDRRGGNRVEAEV